MLQWPAKLLNFEGNNKTELPLREIKFSNNIPNVLPQNFSEHNLHKLALTPKENSNAVFRYAPIPTMKAHKTHSDNSEDRFYFSKPNENSHSNSKPRNQNNNILGIPNYDISLITLEPSSNTKNKININYQTCLDIIPSTYGT